LSAIGKMPHNIAVVRDKNNPSCHRPLISCIGKAQLKMPH
jgi:hypothetical protein